MTVLYNNIILQIAASTSLYNYDIDSTRYQH